MEEVKKRKIFLWLYIILYLPTFLIIISFFLENISILLENIVFSIGFYLLFIDIVLSIFLFIYSVFQKNKVNKPNGVMVLVAFIFDVLIILAIQIPCMAFTHKLANLVTCKSNMEYIARAIDMYENEYKCLPNDLYPASKKGVLVKKNYLGIALVDPKMKHDFIVKYDYKNKTYKVYCPNPEKYYYSPKNTLKALYYDSEKGIVTDPPGK